MENEDEVTVTIKVPKQGSGTFRFAGVIYYDRAHGPRKCGTERAPESFRPAVVDVTGVAV